MFSHPDYDGHEALLFAQDTASGLRALIAIHDTTLGPAFGDATGTVYNLRRLQDFEGVYGQAQVGWAVGEQGKGEMWLQNGNGVYLRLKALREGLALSLGADGMVVRLGG